MSSFADRFGDLTVGDVLELNKAAEWFCGHDVVSECEAEDGD